MNSACINGERECDNNDSIDTLNFIWFHMPTNLYNDNNNNDSCRNYTFLFAVLRNENFFIERDSINLKSNGRKNAIYNAVEKKFDKTWKIMFGVAVDTFALYTTQIGVQTQYRTEM